MQGFIKATLASALIAFGVQAEAANIVQSTTPDKAKIQEVVHEYLMQNPEVIVEALQNFQKKQYEQAEQTVKKTQQIIPQFAQSLFHQANDPFTGNPNGKITVVEFFDYQCPHCVDMAPVIEGIVKANPDVRIVFKEFPIRGPLSEYAARAALAANMQGKYFVFSHALLLNKEPLSQAKILEIAKNVGLNVEQMKQDMTSKKVDDQLKANVKLAQDLKLFGTPAFFIGKTDSTDIQYIPGQMNQTQLQQVIDKAKA